MEIVQPRSCIASTCRTTGPSPHARLAQSNNASTFYHIGVYRKIFSSNCTGGGGAKIQCANVRAYNRLMFHVWDL
jgi:hypothetical protein